MGALSSVLEGAPYGQNVDEAKVSHVISSLNSEVAPFAMLVDLGFSPPRYHTHWWAGSKILFTDPNMRSFFSN